MILGAINNNSYDDTTPLNFTLQHQKMNIATFEEDDSGSNGVGKLNLKRFKGIF